MKFANLLRLMAVLTCFMSGTVRGQASFDDTFKQISDEWAEAFYHLPLDQQEERFKALLPRLEALRGQYPGRAEPLVQQAIVLCTLAAADPGLVSLRRVREARDLLLKSIEMDPRAMEGSAYITLGNLYFRLPGWPISYGDNDIARKYLEVGLKLFPNGLDANYFYGDFLLEEGEYDVALKYLEKAERLPVRPHQKLSDEKLKEQLSDALKAARTGRDNRSDFFSSLLPDFGDEEAKH